MKRYKIALKSDTGLHYVTTVATDETSARSMVCAAENAPLRAVKWCKEILPKIKTLDIVALEWFDRVNGNSYFSGSVTVNFGMDTEQKIWMPFQYGYGDQYISEARNVLLRLYWGEKAFAQSSQRLPSLWRYCEENKIVLRTTKYENCKRKELRNMADLRSR